MPFKIDLIKKIKKEKKKSDADLEKEKRVSKKKNSGVSERPWAVLSEMHLRNRADL